MPWPLLALLSAFSTAASSVTEKRTLASMRTLAFSLRVSYLAALASLPVFFYMGDVDLSLEVLALIAFTATVGAVAYVRVTHGIRKLDIGQSAPLMLLNPAMTALLAFIVLGEEITRIQVVGIVVIAAGAYLIEVRTGGLRGLLAQLAAGEGTRYVMEGMVLYSVTAMMDRILVGIYGVPPIACLALSQVMLAGTMTIYALMLGKQKHVRAALAFPSSACDDPDSPTCEVLQRTSAREWLGTFMVTMFTILNRVFYLFAVVSAPVGPVTAIRRTSALFSTFAGGMINGESNVRRRLLACVVMLVGVTLVSVKW